MTRFPDRLRAAQAAGISGLAAAAILFAMALAGMLAWPDTAAAQCSVFARHPCAPTTCSVFRHRPCTPEFDFPLSENLQLTINSTADARTASANVGQRQDSGAENHRAHDDSAHQQDDGTRKLDNIREMFAALRACWVPPAESDAKPGMEMSVRFAFKRDGEIIGAPRVTYVTPDTPGKVRDRYHTAITQALERCTPMQFTRGMGGAIAGRPIAIRFVDNRKAP